ncbi:MULTISPECIES: rhodanese-like domain-containing protein [unclassified Solwaraspora]|uniref:rhodanese-like domain-containing protein n=1 Tax=unclassified Solwaraspora TaxID=2627926 RepID=UPI00259B043D|nr:rhodanese-like domain-containing protein [Solwaraspora sp. WMMA2056]WJK43263.1 rhodanese-like domain-containing protein [Solwaraspora sp. WMMA2056]
MVTPEPGTPEPGIDRLLDKVRGRLDRVDARTAYQAQQDGEAVLVDIRPAAQRAAHGEIPGAYVIERNVLEWRLDPHSAARLDVADSPRLWPIVVCQEGYASSLAAASLQDTGLPLATDLDGGFAAWRAAGLPVIEPPGTAVDDGDHPERGDAR